MSRNSRTVSVPPQQVWDVLADGWLYPLWVVGASRMRDVDDAWPAPGSRLHHSVGAWPALLDDTTEVLERREPAFLKLRARAWPGGAAEVALHLTPTADGGTEIVIEEDAVSGPGALVPSLLRQPPLTWRNVETLRRLALIVERRR
ncbi:SRPBCC family protein [Nocardioides sp.]|uniref:SRPBCC family protein n=1 Tax=Nocardioides sp. TaxID=35761 RepID=UPI00286B75D2|nr:SRPBCC family protein [Nocardioides sp.]